MSYNETETRVKLINPALYGCGWTEDMLRYEETAGSIEIVDGAARRQSRGRVDYTLRIKADAGTQPVAVALIEAKAEHLPPDHGLEQGKSYADSKRLNVPFVYATNGHLFVEYDRFTETTAAHRPMAEFPSPASLRARYEQGVGFSLDDPAALPLLTPYSAGDGSRRYYQDAAIRAALEKIARGEKRVLLSMATGCGKTKIAVNLLKRIADAKLLGRALFVCDRDELRGQGTAAFQAVFGADAAAVGRGNPQKTARILIATYQTLGVDGAEADASFLTENYPPDFFTHILIDECHRSAWGKWSQVLTRNPNAVQVGLTATPRELVTKEKSVEVTEDLGITADNTKHFGKPVYEYEIGQGIEDGYLAACQIVRRNVFLDKQDKHESETGVTQSDLNGKIIRDADTGAVLVNTDTRARYEASSFEASLVLPDRVQAMCADLFGQLLETGGPLQKTILFCASDRHADMVATEMGNLYIRWCQENAEEPADHYAFKCTAASGGGDFLPDLRGSSRSHFLATTVELLTTGVDVPALRNVVFFKYVKSPISFYQMVGRGTRLDPATGKLMFHLYDYTNATRLFGHDFLTKATAPRKAVSDGGGAESAPTLRVEGFDVKVTPAGHLILATVDGKATPVTVEEYKAQLAAKLVEAAPTLDEFRARWVVPPDRHALLDGLPDAGRSPDLVRALSNMADFDLYDVLAEVGYGMAPRTRDERAAAFEYKQAEWLRSCPSKAAATLRAIARQFARAGTDGLESQFIFQTYEVKQAGGLAALLAMGNPAAVVMDTKARMFAA